MNKPTLKPIRPFFSSGPCAKRPGWSLAALEGALLSRSHRSSDGKARLKDIIDRHRATLGIPDDYRIGITAASDTGAIEMAMWSLLGPRPVDVLSFDTFSRDWAIDVITQLKLPQARVFETPFGTLPDLRAVDTDHDVVMVWNGTTSGVVIPDGDWIKPNRAGLTLVDATSAVYAYEMPWDKLDVVTWSWQKVVGSEAGHGMIVLSPRAIERLQTYTPSWPIPKIFRLAKDGVVSEGLFAGETINTPSLLCVEDCRDALEWVAEVGGWQGTRARCLANAGLVRDWAAKQSWLDELAFDPKTRSITSVCFKFKGPWIDGQPKEAQQKIVKDFTSRLEREGVAFDIGSYRDAPAGLRIWCGATVEQTDLAALLPWLEWAYAQSA
jgi:phosphoserine aminotransferase